MTVDQRFRVDWRLHWFVPAALSVLFVNALVVGIDGWQSPRLKEAGLVFDLVILLPVLYLICYRDQGKAAIIKSLGLACLGIGLASLIVPKADQLFLEVIGPLRYLGLVVLFALQIKMMKAVYIAAFSSKQSPEVAAKTELEKADLPPWVARLMAWEAGLWRRAWDWLKGR